MQLDDNIAPKTWQRTLRDKKQDTQELDTTNMLGWTGIINY